MPGLLVVACLALILAGCGGGGSGGSTTASISGYVKDSATLAPIVEAEYRLEGGGRTFTAYADSSGHFALAGLPVNTPLAATVSAGNHQTVSWEENFPAGSWQYISAILLQPVEGGSDAVNLRFYDLAPGQTYNLPDTNTITDVGVMLFGQTTTPGSYNASVTINVGGTKRSYALPRSAASISPVSTDLRSLLDQKIRETPRALAGEQKADLEAAVRADPALGSQRTFWATALPADHPEAPDPDLGRWDQVTATLKAIGPSCLVYGDNAHPLDQLDQQVYDDIKQQFEDGLSIMRQYFGEEASPTAKTVLLMTELESNAEGWIVGYFHPINMYASAPYDIDGDGVKENLSNGCKMLYLTTYKPASYDDAKWLETVKGTVAHEFQHMIYWSHRRTQSEDGLLDTWLNEGLSCTATDLVMTGQEYVHTAGNDSLVTNHLKKPGESLTTWGNSPQDYCEAYMFLRYLADRFGVAKLEEFVAASDSLDAMQDVSLVTGVPFYSLFRDWIMTVLVDKYAWTMDDRFNYQSMDLFSFPESLALSSTGPTYVTETGTNYIVFTDLSSTEISVTVTGSATGARVVYLVQGSVSPFIAPAKAQK